MRYVTSRHSSATYLVIGATLDKKSATTELVFARGVRLKVKSAYEKLVRMGASPATSHAATRIATRLMRMMDTQTYQRHLGVKDAMCVCVYEKMRKQTELGSDG